MRPEDAALSYTVPGPPVPCARVRVVRGGHVFTPDKTAAYQQRIAVFALQAMQRVRWARGGRGPFRVELDVYREANRGDADNYAKNPLDAMTKAGAWADDRYVTELLVRLRVDRERPRLEVSVRCLEDGSSSP